MSIGGLLWTAPAEIRLNLPSSTKCSITLDCLFVLMLFPTFWLQFENWDPHNKCNFSLCVFLPSLRSPALKPFWRHLVGTDAENLFSSLFKRLFCDSSAHYREGRTDHGHIQFGHSLTLVFTSSTLTLHEISSSWCDSNGLTSMV